MGEKYTHLLNVGTSDEGGWVGSVRGVTFYIFTTVMCAVVRNWSGDRQQNTKVR